MITMNEKPKRHTSIETTTLPDGHAVLVSKETEWAYTLTPVGALVWEFCDGTNSVDEIVANIQSIPEFSDCPPKKAEISALLEQLVDAGFLEDEPDSIP